MPLFHKTKDHVIWALLFHQNVQFVLETFSFASGTCQWTTINYVGIPLFMWRIGGFWHWTCWKGDTRNFFTFIREDQFFYCHQRRDPWFLGFWAKKVTIYPKFWLRKYPAKTIEHWPPFCLKDFFCLKELTPSFLQIGWFWVFGIWERLPILFVGEYPPPGHRHWCKYVKYWLFQEIIASMSKHSKLF